ncbi:MAG: hypothetical protein ACLFU8_02490 [Anaerolineales bacterium]
MGREKNWRVEKYLVEVEYNEQGVPYIEGFPDASIYAEKNGNVYTIKGNSDGLLFLAHCLVALAKASPVVKEQGYHIHLDSLYNINESDVEILLAVVEDQDVV